jgi:hypothetical protein
MRIARTHEGRIGVVEFGRTRLRVRKCKLRDSLGVDQFGAFTDLINYYTDINYWPRVDINLNLQASGV